jgi:thioredoxin-dependent peroxiredoxin
MAELKTGDLTPDFTLPRDGEGDITLSSFHGRKVVLYFYPKDDTPGCTTESCNFRDNLSALNKLQAQVIGISRDTVASHNKFRDKYSLTFPLASDADGKVCEAYGVWKEKSMYGKKYMGIERSTFLIDENGKIARIWRNVKVPGHVDEVIESIRDTAQAA